MSTNYGFRCYSHNPPVNRSVYEDPRIGFHEAVGMLVRFGEGFYADAWLANHKSCVIRIIDEYGHAFDAKGNELSNEDVVKLRPKCLATLVLLAPHDPSAERYVCSLEADHTPVVSKGMTLYSHKTNTGFYWRVE